MVAALCFFSFVSNPPPPAHIDDGAQQMSFICYWNDRLKVVNVGMNRLQDRYEWRSGVIGTGSVQVIWESVPIV